ncbi:molybdopterin-dependent oxidoreductase [Massilia sp. CFBP9012]|uniref:molybdopterin-dependent oxidoreductase n=1 Tax=Massilia sp. CFBP9012 TaxID=3096531 RepID=UPI002A6AAAB1|nr:molybdopterin-dependent oxidoreductase [Massilia sp. CFBP9012]MDY0974342.1 molybdopterin-dependent oxidoreductase [Massilia sp. CFBP9012]
MDKRHFLGAAALAGTAPAFASRSTVPGPATGPTLLTITGAITRSNRGALDPALDQMMAKQKLAFDRAYGLDFAALTALPARTIRPTLEYDGKPHTLRGPLLADVLAQAGAKPRDAAKVLMRAVDGYAAVLEMRQLRACNYIVATHLDGKAMPLGGLGPLWAVYDADRVPEMAALPVAQRFGACPWALYHLEVMA